jgi:hypothetical protein
MATRPPPTDAWATVVPWSRSRYAAHPEAPALEWRGRTLSYGELGARVRALSSRLIETLARIAYMLADGRVHTVLAQRRFAFDLEPCVAAASTQTHLHYLDEDTTPPRAPPARAQAAPERALRPDRPAAARRGGAPAG